jgi:hypothetical protein
MNSGSIIWSFDHLERRTHQRQQQNSRKRKAMGPQPSQVLAQVLAPLAFLGSVCRLVLIAGSSHLSRLRRVVELPELVVLEKPSVPLAG